MIKQIIPILILVLISSAAAQQIDNLSIQNLKHDVNSIPLLEDETKLNFSLEDSKRNVGLGVIYSLLLPGMGELYADAYDIGKYFTIADGALWGAFIGMNVYSNWKENDYKSYAESRASITNENKDESYYATISAYSDIDSYNDEKALERNFDEMYDRDKYFWKWNSEVERESFRDMWSSSEQTRNDIRFIVGGLILNRIASAINAARLVSSYNSRLEEELSWNFSVGFVNNPTLPTSLNFNFTASF
ncbi:MAG: hypothetical protein KJN64_04645 [Ignavibacteria bacterium]|nr:hypothetical protein [Ignavibacteria bacterium]